MWSIFFMCLFLYASLKWSAYYFSTRGLLYYMGMKYDDIPDAEKIKELQEKALERTILELFGKN